MEQTFKVLNWMIMYFLSFNLLAQTPTVDLTTHNPDGIQPNGIIEWHNGLPISANTIISNPTQVSPGLYYAVYNYGGGCYSQPSPLRILATSCPAKTIDLNDAVLTTNLNQNIKITFHTSLPVSGMNQMATTLASSASEGTYYVAYLDTISNCYSNPSPIVVVETNCCPPSPSLTTSNSVSICNGQSLTLSANCSSGTLQWYSNSMLTGTPLSNNIVNPDVTTTYYASCENTFCKSPSVSLLVSVRLVTSPTINSVSRCGVGSLNLTAAGCNGEIRWYSQSTSYNILSTSNPFVTPTLVESQSYYATCFNDNCESERSSMVATINQEPVVEVSGVNPTCLGAFAQNNGQILSSKYYETDTFSISEGNTFNSTFASTPSPIPNDGILKKDILVVTSTFYTVRVITGTGCFKDYTINLQNICPQCVSPYCDTITINKSR